MADPSLEEHESEGDDDLTDEIAETIVRDGTRRAVRVVIRIGLGLTVFGMLWYFFDWAKWLFWGYVVLAALSVALHIYLHLKLVASLTGVLESASEESDSTTAANPGP